MADLEIFWENCGFRDEASKTFVADLANLDEGLMPDMSGEVWAFLADKLYQGAAE